MSTLKQVKKDVVNNFIYEMQNVPVYGGNSGAGNASYYSDWMLEQLIKESLKAVTEKLELKYTMEDIEDIPNFIIKPLETLTAVKAIDGFITDVEHNCPKPLTLFSDDKELLEKTKDTLITIKENYIEVYDDLIEFADLNIIKTLFKVEIPDVGDDEILVVKVGSDERPAREEDITAILDNLQQARSLRDNGEKVTVVTHHVIDFVKVKRQHLDPLYVEGV